MNDRDRLIELLEQHCLLRTDYLECTASEGTKCSACLADHLISNGVIVPPCKVGEKIYMLVTRKTHSFMLEKGKGMMKVKNQHTFIKPTRLTKLNFFKVLDDFGKTAFLTREEAEAKLRECEQGCTTPTT